MSLCSRSCCNILSLNGGALSHSALQDKSRLNRSWCNKAYIISHDIMSWYIQCNVMDGAIRHGQTR